MSVLQVSVNGCVVVALISVYYTMRLNEYISYYLYPRYIDMNKGIECLSELIRQQMNANPLSGDAFLFFDQRK